MDEWMDEERRVPNLFGDFVGSVQVQLSHSSSLSKAPPPKPQGTEYRCFGSKEPGRVGLFPPAGQGLVVRYASLLACLSGKCPWMEASEVNTYGKVGRKVN